MTWWQEILARFGGDAALIVLLAFLGRSLIQTWLAKDLKNHEDSLARGAKSFELELKAKAELEIERLKASFVRASRVHERQLEILSELNRYFLDAESYFQRMTSSLRFSSEPSPEEYEQKVVGAMEGARQTLLRGSLLIPKSLVKTCDEFFRVVRDGRFDFSSAQAPGLDHDEKRKLWKEAAIAANKELPKLLEQIDTAARSVVHGDQP